MQALTDLRVCLRCRSLQVLQCACANAPPHWCALSALRRWGRACITPPAAAVSADALLEHGVRCGRERHTSTRATSAARRHATAALASSSHTRLASFAAHACPCTRSCTRAVRPSGGATRCMTCVERAYAHEHTHAESLPAWSSAGMPARGCLTVCWWLAGCWRWARRNAHGRTLLGQVRTLCAQRAQVLARRAPRRAQRPLAPADRARGRPGAAAARHPCACGRARLRRRRARRRRWLLGVRRGAAGRSSRVASTRHRRADDDTLVQTTGAGQDASLPASLCKSQASFC